MSTLDDDGHPSSDFIAIEAEHDGGQQALWIGVRPIWYGDERGEVMVQIEYQEHYNGGPLAGPVWLTPQTWRQVAAAVEWRLQRHETRRTRIRRWIARHENLFAFLWYLHLVRNEKPK